MRIGFTLNQKSKAAMRTIGTFFQVFMDIFPKMNEALATMATMMA